MVRIKKDPLERKLELINTAEELFSVKGYKNTAVSDIVKEINVAQGTFYYYFKSKEEIFLAIFDRYAEENAFKLKDIVNNSTLSLVEKANKMILIQFESIKNHTILTSQLHDEEYIALHQKANLNIIKKYTPIYSQLFQQGIEQGVIKSKYPCEMAEFILLITNCLFNPKLFEITINEYKQKIAAFDEMICQTFRLKSNFLTPEVTNEAIELYNNITANNKNNNL